MKRIDFLGAPGVGKSTLYNAFLQKCSERYNLYSEFAARIKAVKNFNKIYGGKEKLGIQLLLNLPKLRNPYVISIEDRIEKIHFEEYIKTLNELCSIVNEAFCQSTKDNYRRQYGYISFNKKLKIYCSLENYFNGIMTSDESLSQKVYGISPSDEIKKEIVNEYFQKIPEPEKLIYCFTEPEKIVDRIIGRKKRIPSHRNKDRDELFEKTKIALEIAEIGANILSKRGVEIVEIEMDKKISVNVDKIISMLFKK